MAQVFVSISSKMAQMNISIYTPKRPKRGWLNQKEFKTHCVSFSLLLIRFATQCVVFIISVQNRPGSVLASLLSLMVDKAYTSLQRSADYPPAKFAKQQYRLSLCKEGLLWAECPLDLSSAPVPMLVPMLVPKPDLIGNVNITDRLQSITLYALFPFTNNLICFLQCVNPDREANIISASGLPFSNRIQMFIDILWNIQANFF